MFFKHIFFKVILQVDRVKYVEALLVFPEIEELKRCNCTSNAYANHSIKF